MNAGPIKWFLRVVVTLAIFVYLFFIIKINRWDFTEFISWVNAQVDDESLTKKVQSILNKKNFGLLQKASLFSLIPILGLFLFGILNENKIFNAFQSIVDESILLIKNQVQYLKTLSKIERLILVSITVVFFIKSYWYVFNWPMQYDEAWTFNHFINRSWFVTLFAPHNNHIFYTVIAKLSYHIFFFLRPIEAIRLPLPLFAFGSALLLYFFTNKLFNQRVAILSFAIFLGIGPVVFYSLYARAYILGIFFSALFLYQVFSFSKKSTIINKLGFVFAGILAIYSIQSSIYFIIPVWFGGLFLIVKNRRNFKAYILLSTLMLMGFLFIYAPILITSKLDWLVDSSSKTEFNWMNEAMAVLRQLGAIITGFPMGNHIPFFILIGLAVWGLIREKQNRWFFVLTICCLFVPALAIALQKRILPFRIFVYLVIFAVPCWAYFIDSVLHKIKVKQIIPFLALSLFFIHSYKSHHLNFFNWSNKWDNLTEELFTELENNEIHDVYNYYFYAKPALEYFSFERDHHLDIKMPKKVSIDYQDFNEKEWESVVWWKSYKGEKPDISNYKKVWESRTVELYIKN